MTASLFENPKTRALPAAERDSRILALRGAGVPHLQIAAQVGCAERTVRRVCERRLAQLREQITLDSRTLVAQQLSELEMLRGRLRPALVAKDQQHRIGAVRAWLSLLEREARLLGLDQPQRIEVAAQSQAAEALLQHLADQLAPAVMEEVVHALAQL